MKQRRGLRVREAMLIVCILFLPALLVAFGIPPDTPLCGRWGVALVANIVIAVVLTCAVEDRLERRGRFVDSGVSWEEIRSWWRRWSNYVAALFNCFLVILSGFAIWLLSDDVSELGLLVVMWTALAALNIIFARH